jgi:hypothetical protein
LFRGKLDALFLVEGCQPVGYTLGFVSGWELLSGESLKRGRGHLRAASSAYGN